MPRSRLLLSAALILGIVTLWAETAPSDQRGGLPRISEAVATLSTMVYGLASDLSEVQANVDDLTEAVCGGDLEDCPALECRCFTRDEIEALDPMLCEVLTQAEGTSGNDRYTARQVLVSVNRAGYAVNANLLGSPDGSCVIPDFGAIDLSFAEARRCQRIIEDVLGPCGPFEIPPQQ
jgi:hypothetical protein